MLFHRSSEIAIQAVLFLAQQPPGKLTPVHEIAEHAGASEAYLAKVLQRLASAGLVRAFRGPGKGVELGGAPEVITLCSVIVAAQGSLNLDQCVLGLPVCSDERPCALHRDWAPLRAKICDLVEKITLAELIRSAHEGSSLFAAELFQAQPVPAVLGSDPTGRKQP